MTGVCQRVPADSAQVQRPRIDFRFAEGVLDIRSPLCNLRMRWDPLPMAEERDHRGVWRPAWPEFRIIRPHSDHVVMFEREAPIENMTSTDKKALSQALQAFRDAGPADIVSVVERFGSHQWALAQLLCRERDALDLARSNPVLAYCLANSSEFRGSPAEAAAFQSICYCRRKRRFIAKWLGFPAAEATVRIFAKILPEVAYPSILRRFRTALKEDVSIQDKLAHLRIINAGVLELLANSVVRPRVTGTLLAEVSECSQEQYCPRVVGTLHEVLRLSQAFAPPRPLPDIVSISQIDTLIVRLETEYQEYEQNKRQQECRRRIAVETAQREALFPTPPVPGMPGITPIACLEDLRDEGRQQHNCVASYAGSVRKGETYIYRVAYPERATLSIVRGPNGLWRRDQIKRSHNRAVRQSTKNAVDRWLTLQQAHGAGELLRR